MSYFVQQRKKSRKVFQRYRNIVFSTSKDTFLNLYEKEFGKQEEICIVLDNSLIYAWNFFKRFFISARKFSIAAWNECLQQKFVFVSGMS